MLPGEFRKQFFIKHITEFSSVKNIRKDFEKLLYDFNSIKEKNRQDIFKFYIDFMSVHPF
jgi:fido (protein-threonine AMPylation protein)